MCGIVGYLGDRPAYPMLIQGLRRLEYRGYDSAGVALVHENGTLDVFKSKGKVADLERATQGRRRFGHHRDRAHPLGHAWRTKRRKCAPALFAIENPRYYPQRHYRELQRTARNVAQPRLHLPERHRYRSTGTTDRVHQADLTIAISARRCNWPCTKWSAPMRSQL